MVISLALEATLRALADPMYGNKMLEINLGFVGAGQMAQALARGLVQAESILGRQLSVYDPLPEAVEAFRQHVPDARAAGDNRQVVADSDVFILAVKPQAMQAVFDELRGHVGPGSLVVSIAAGVSLERLCSGLDTQRVIRVMPNTPCLVGCGAAAYALAEGVSAADGELVGQLLSTVGTSACVPEEWLDAITGLSGSGPAFVFAMIEALSDGGVLMGLPRELSTAFATQTVRGAAQMVTDTGEHPAILRDRVTSPGGTTIAGLQVLESRAVRAACIAAVQAAADRSRVLSRQ